VTLTETSGSATTKTITEVVNETSFVSGETAIIVAAFMIFASIGAALMIQRRN
jgi:hypothetical protein